MEHCASTLVGKHFCATGLIKVGQQHTFRYFLVHLLQRDPTNLGSHVGANVGGVHVPLPGKQRHRKCHAKTILREDVPLQIETFSLQVPLLDFSCCLIHVLRHGVGLHRIAFFVEQHLIVLKKRLDVRVAVQSIFPDVHLVDE